MKDNPYVGPRPYTRADCDRFYGRSRRSSADGADGAGVAVITGAKVAFYVDRCTLILRAVGCYMRSIGAACYADEWRHKTPEEVYTAKHRDKTPERDFIQQVCCIT